MVSLALSPWLLLPPLEDGPPQVSGAAARWTGPIYDEAVFCCWYLPAIVDGAPCVWGAAANWTRGPKRALEQVRNLSVHKRRRWVRGALPPHSGFRLGKFCRYLIRTEWIRQARYLRLPSSDSNIRHHTYDISVTNDGEPSKSSSGTREPTTSRTHRSRTVPVAMVPCLFDPFWDGFDIED